MRLRMLLAPLAVTALLVTPVFLDGQSGPRKESGDTSARPKKKSDTNSVEVLPDPDAPKIPSKMTKKKGDGSWRANCMS